MRISSALSAIADAKRRQSFQEKIGMAVRSARGFRMSQEEVAQKAGITRSHLSNIELGKVDVSVHVLYLIAKATGTTLSKILKDLG
jgi:transcriptional regulator with XRE-family HTH domain